MNIKRYLTIYAALWKNSVAREMSFKGNFLLWIIVELLWFGLQLSFVTVIFTQTDSVGTWTKWQMVMLVGASNFIQQVYQAFFLVNCTNLSELVRTGKMDFLMALPVNTRFLVSLRVVDLGAFINAALTNAPKSTTRSETRNRVFTGSAMRKSILPVRTSSERFVQFVRKNA